jgi:hypothetical protein
MWLTFAVYVAKRDSRRWRSYVDSGKDGDAAAEGVGEVRVGGEKAARMRWA